MFDVYLQSKQPNRKSQRLLALASVLSTVATAVFLVVLWLQGKMGINMVDPPTIEFVLVQLTDVDAAPPPPPPPPPAGDTSEEEEEEVPEDDLVEGTTSARPASLLSRSFLSSFPFVRRYLFCFSSFRCLGCYSKKFYCVSAHFVLKFCSIISASFLLVSLCCLLFK